MKCAGLRTRCTSALLICALMQVSCATLVITGYKEVKAEDIPGQLKQGDIIKIETRDGRVITLTLVTIAPEALVGTPIPGSTPEGSEVKDQRVELADVVRLEKGERREGIGKIIALVLLFPVILLLLLFSLPLAPFHS